eukprot:9472613-Pyramimonas_sp.AAC.1
MGIVKNARSGQVMVVPSTLNPATWTLHVIAGATLIESMCKAMDDMRRSNRQNPQVQTTWDGGVENVLFLKPETPLCVLRWLKDEMNKMLKIGNPRNYGELHQHLDHVQEEFTAFVEAEKTAGRTFPEAGKAGYETKYGEWLSQSRLAR